MLLLPAGLVYTGLTLYALRGGLAGERGLAVVGFDPRSLAMGGLAVILAAWYFGPLFGLALIFAVMIHEFGHVAAFRVAGHSDARFRLVPLAGGHAISDRPPGTQAEAFFIALLGPGISVAPMVLGFALAEAAAGPLPLAGQFFFTFAAVTAALNFLNLLPFWPLDGGRCIRLVAASVSPRLARAVTLAMSAALAAAAIWLQSVLLFVLAMLGLPALFQTEADTSAQPPMSGGQSILALAAYLFTGAAHLAGGGWLVTAYF